MPPKASKKTLKKKLDRKLQEIGRQVYTGCLVCGKKMSCLHHFYPKGMSLRLRYDWENMIPLCVGCHFSHHNGNPEVHEKVIKVKGEDWLNNLKLKKMEIVSDAISHYRDMEEKLNGLLKDFNKQL